MFEGRVLQEGGRRLADFSGVAQSVLLQSHGLKTHQYSSALPVSIGKLRSITYKITTKAHQNTLKTNIMQCFL
jgi:hypothetical protein